MDFDEGILLNEIKALLEQNQRTLEAIGNMVYQIHKKTITTQKQENKKNKKEKQKETEEEDELEELLEEE